MDSENVNLTKDDFIEAKFEEIISGISPGRCQEYLTSFFKKANQCHEEGKIKQSRVFKLIAEMTSYFLRLDHPYNPFEPKMEFSNGTRWPIPDDIPEVYIDILGELVSNVSDAELRARIADVVWQRKRDHKIAQLTVDAYLDSSDNLKNLDIWKPRGDNIERALQISAILDKKGECYNKVIGHIEAVIQASIEGGHPRLPMRLMELLLEHNKGDASKYADIAEQLAKRAEQSNDPDHWDNCERFWTIRAKWCSRQKKEEAKVSALESAAEVIVKQAEEKEIGNAPNWGAAVHFYGKAINLFRKIGGKKDRINELHLKMIECQRRLPEGLQEVSTSVNIGQSIEQSKSLVRGKNILDGLLKLAQMVPPRSVTFLKQEVKEDAQSLLLSFMMPSSKIDSNGRAVARKPAASIGDQDTESKALNVMAIENAAFYQHLAVMENIEPARKQILQDNDPRLHEIVAITSNNPVIPQGREMIYAKGLYAGLLGSFVESTHLLMPQFENSIRCLFDQERIITSGFDDKGIQEVFDLNRLLYMKEFNERFGDDSTFDMQVLLTERFGSNLRNRFAHGLMSYEDFFNYDCKYFWWISMRFCLIPMLIYYNKLDRQIESNDNDKNDGMDKLKN